MYYLYRLIIPLRSGGWAWHSAVVGSDCLAKWHGASIVQTELGSWCFAVGDCGMKSRGKETAMIEVKCPKCAKIWEMPSSLSGASEKCPACGQDFIVPVIRQIPISRQPPMASAPNRKVHWAGIVALLLGFFIGGWAANGLYNTRQKGRLELATIEIRHLNSVQESQRWNRNFIDSSIPTTPIGEVYRAQVDELGHKIETEKNRFRVKEFLTRGGLGNAAYPVAAFGSILAIIGLVLAIKTRKSDVGLGTVAIIFFLAAIGVGCLLTGIVDAKLKSENVSLRQFVEANDSSFFWLDE